MRTIVDVTQSYDAAMNDLFSVIEIVLPIVIALALFAFIRNVRNGHFVSDEENSPSCCCCRCRREESGGAGYGAGYIMGSMADGGDGGDGGGFGC